MILRDTGENDFNAMVKTLVGRGGATVTVAQYNPPRKFDIPTADIDGMLLIVGSFFYG